jgi:hypothetical protein
LFSIRPCALFETETERSVGKEREKSGERQGQVQRQRSDGKEREEPGERERQVQRRERERERERAGGGGLKSME